MAYAFKRSIAAMSVTTSTTCAAFLSNAFSKIMPIQAFGIYAAIIIPVNFILVCQMLPPMIIFYDKYLAHRYCCIACSKAERKIKYSQDAEVQGGCADRFFGGPWNSCIRKLRWLILVLFTGWTGYACYIAKDVRPLSSEEKMFKPDHPVSIIGEILKNDFGNGNLRGLDVTVFWGVKNLNKADTSMWVPEDIGQVIFEDEFDLSSVEA